MKDAGFDTFSTRTAWQHLEERTHVVNFQSFNSYMAGGLKCTTFSFGLNLSVLYRAVPFRFFNDPEEATDLYHKPHECYGQFRRHLERKWEQAELDRKDIWFVRADGSNVNEVFDHLVTSVSDEILPWFDYYSDLNNALKTCLSDEGPYRRDLMATMGSPERNRLTGYLAIALGQTEFAAPYLERFEVYYQKALAEHRAYEKRYPKRTKKTK